MMCFFGQPWFDALKNAWIMPILLALKLYRVGRPSFFEHPVTRIRSNEWLRGLLFHWQISLYFWYGWISSTSFCGVLVFREVWLIRQVDKYVYSGGFSLVIDKQKHNLLRAQDFSCVVGVGNQRRYWLLATCAHVLPRTLVVTDVSLRLKTKISSRSKEQLWQRFLNADNGKVTQRFVFFAYRCIR